MLYIPKLLKANIENISPSCLRNKYSISSGLQICNDNKKQPLDSKTLSSHYLLSFCKLPPNDTMNNVLPNRQIKNISR